jgi:hypothetical protein
MMVHQKKHQVWPMTCCHMTTCLMWYNCSMF